MVRFELLLGLASLALGIYCLIDILRTPDHEIPGLPKLAWAVLVLLFSLPAGIAWLVLRKRKPRQAATGVFPEYDRPGRARGLTPESDEEFLRRVRERAEEQRRIQRERERKQEEDEA